MKYLNDSSTDTGRLMAVHYVQWHQLFDEGKALMDDIVAVPEVTRRIAALQTNAEEIRNAQLALPELCAPLRYDEIRRLESTPFLIRVVFDHTAASRKPSPSNRPFDVGFAHSDYLAFEDPSFILTDGSLCYEYGTPGFEIITRSMLPTQHQLSHYRFLMSLARDALATHNEFFANAD